MPELAFRVPDRPVRLHPVGTRPLVVGRDAGVDVVLPESSISRHHAKFWVEADRLFVRDLGSLNGTWLNRSRVTGPAVVRPGDLVRIGHTVTVEIHDSAPAAFEEVVLQLVRADAGPELPLLPGVFRMGPGADCDFPLAGDGSTAVFLLSGDGTVEREVGEGWEPVALGAIVEVGGERFYFERTNVHSAPTSQSAPTTFSYKVSAGFHPSGDAWTELEDPHGGKRLRCDGGNKGVILYLLAQPHLLAPLHPADDGWIVDEQLMSGIWGRHGDANKLYVLIHRVRAEVARAGLDASCIEKRSGITRLRLDGPGQPVRGRAPG